ncbi:Putative uncharacterized protein [Halomonas sp. R57-5]|nr:Putative uncharacterized protein [Halomonas sp. R57-5]
MLARSIKGTARRAWNRERNRTSDISLWRYPGDSSAIKKNTEQESFPIYRQPIRLAFIGADKDEGSSVFNLTG